jgi:hypothetical protein
MSNSIQMKKQTIQSESNLTVGENTRRVPGVKSLFVTIVDVPTVITPNMRLGHNVRCLAIRLDWFAMAVVDAIK